MRRPIIGIKPQTKLNTDTIVRQRTDIRLDNMMLEKRLRLKRSNTLVATMTELDAGGAIMNKEQIKQLIYQMVQEFPELQKDQLPLGIVSKCYLGHPYEVHSLDCNLEIIEHYTYAQIVPNGMEKARKLALHPSYAYIEVYEDKLCAVSKFGDVSMIKG